MRHVLTVLLVVGLFWGGLKLKRYFNSKLAEANAKAGLTTQTAPGKLPGMEPELEASLDTARKGGAEALRAWLLKHRAEMMDPRLAEIELDYAVLVGRTRPSEARGVLDALRRRLEPTSPVYKRFQQLDKAY